MAHNGLKEKRLCQRNQLAQQRQVGARFVANVLDLTDDPQVKNGQEIAGKAGVTADELSDALSLLKTRPH